MHDSHRALVRAGYDRVGERYLDDRPTNGADVGLLQEFVDRVGTGHTVLDAGCGAGVPVAAQMIGAGVDVVGLDFAAGQLDLARSRVPRALLMQADLAALPFDDESFDGLVSYYAVIHVPRAGHRTVMAEFYRVLRPGGSALLCLGANDNPADEDSEAWLGTPMFWSHFDAATNRDLVRDAGLRIVWDRIIPDPMGHGGHLFVLAIRP